MTPRRADTAVLKSFRNFEYSGDIRAISAVRSPVASFSSAAPTVAIASACAETGEDYQ